MRSDEKIVATFFMRDDEAIHRVAMTNYVNLIVEDHSDEEVDLAFAEVVFGEASESSCLNFVTLWEQEERLKALSYEGPFPLLITVRIALAWAAVFAGEYDEQYFDFEANTYDWAYNEVKEYFGFMPTLSQVVEIAQNEIDRMQSPGYEPPEDYDEDTVFDYLVKAMSLMYDSLTQAAPQRLINAISAADSAIVVAQYVDMGVDSDPDMLATDSLGYTWSNIVGNICKSMGIKSFNDIEGDMEMRLMYSIKMLDAEVKMFKLAADITATHQEEL